MCLCRGRGGGGAWWYEMLILNAVVDQTIWKGIDESTSTATGLFWGEGGGQTKMSQRSLLPVWLSG